MSSSILTADAQHGTRGAHEEDQGAPPRKASLTSGTALANILTNGRPGSPTAVDGVAGSTIPGKKGSAKLSRKDAVPSEPAIDPLSHHIFVRTNTDHSIPSKLRAAGRPDSPAANEGLPRPSSDLSAKQATTAQLEPGKDKKKPASFLSRLSMIGNKKKDDYLYDDESEISELRTEGVNAVAFSSVVGGAGYIPHHKEPPRYIKVRAHGKKAKEFDRMFLAQQLVGTQPPKEHVDANTAINGAPVQPVHGFGHRDINNGGPIWAMEFSKDGKYLATAGRDRIVRIWGVIATSGDRTAYEEEVSSDVGSTGERLSAPVFRTHPLRELAGHTGEILDLSWSKNNFLLSSSMDKTVRLWHISRQECLCTFKHKDFVTSIAFHPRDDRFFLAGSLDSILRLWSIPDKAVAYSSQISDLITAVAFSPDGKTCIAGCLNGLCTFYETEGLKFGTQMYVRSSRGKNAKGSKITGIHTMAFPPDAPDGEVKVLVTSNDSRIRIYNLRDKAMEMKIKGHENSCNQIRATFSDDAKYVICGSEDRKAFIWSTGPSQGDNKEKRPCEYFEAHSAIVTQAVFAPTVTRQLLQASEDPIFTLCNPPPITLVSKGETNASQTTLPQETECDTAKVTKPESTPAFKARSKHLDGNIIVTSDHDGIIKVFRQDCAFVKRRHETWETGSTFSRKLGRDGLLGRTGSIMTKTSVSSRDPHSRRGSITQPPQVNSERIMSWRQGIEGTPSSRPSSIAMATPARSERSVSPAKARTPTASNTTNLASEARRPPYTSSIASPSLPPMSPTPSIQSHEHERPHATDKFFQPPTPSFTFRSVDDESDGGLRLDPAGASYSFWNLNRWRGIGSKPSEDSGHGSEGPEKRHNRVASEAPIISMGHDSEDQGRRKSLGARVMRSQTDKSDKSDLNSRRKSVPLKTHDTSRLAPPDARPGYERHESVVSTLTSEGLTSGSTSDGGNDLRCSKCGGRDFKTKKVGTRQRLICSQCGRMAEA
ncbi:hypothetical protein JX266_012917 [Neoarthrinium moseri]|nr:hypothetical protein JX266_012917 [Neoarthrinium moseri]